MNYFSIFFIFVFKVVLGSQDNEPKKNNDAFLDTLQRNNHEKEEESEINVSKNGEMENQNREKMISDENFKIHSYGSNEIPTELLGNDDEISFNYDVNKAQNTILPVCDEKPSRSNLDNSNQPNLKSKDSQSNVENNTIKIIRKEKDKNAVKLEEFPEIILDEYCVKLRIEEPEDYILKEEGCKIFNSPDPQQISGIESSLTFNDFEKKQNSDPLDRVVDLEKEMQNLLARSFLETDSQETGTQKIIKEQTIEGIENGKGDSYYVHVKQITSDNPCEVVPKNISDSDFGSNHTEKKPILSCDEKIKNESDLKNVSDVAELSPNQVSENSEQNIKNTAVTNIQDEKTGDKNIQLNVSDELKGCETKKEKKGIFQRFRNLFSFRKKRSSEKKDNGVKKTKNKVHENKDNISDKFNRSSWRRTAIKKKKTTPLDPIEEENPHEISKNRPQSTPDIKSTFSDQKISEETNLDKNEEIDENSNTDDNRTIEILTIQKLITESKNEKLDTASTSTDNVTDNLKNEKNSSVKDNIFSSQDEKIHQRVSEEKNEAALKDRHLVLDSENVDDFVSSDSNSQPLFLDHVVQIHVEGDRTNPQVNKIELEDNPKINNECCSNDNPKTYEKTDDGIEGKFAGDNSISNKCCDIENQGSNTKKNMKTLKSVDEKIQKLTYEPVYKTERGKSRYRFPNYNNPAENK